MLDSPSKTAACKSLDTCRFFKLNPSIRFKALYCVCVCVCSCVRACASLQI